ncbi:hypothetical protein B566_EDAN004896 [Ephemera danica]|nr:hypothetical protein B566_EDAN004896 [Ephemera danica]
MCISLSMAPITNNQQEHQNLVQVESPNVRYTKDYIEADFDYHNTKVHYQGSRIVATPTTTRYQFRTRQHVPRMGLMLVGWGGNNGSTLTAALLANKLSLSWNTKEGEHHADLLGSITQASTVQLGEGVHVPMNSLLPMVNPRDIVLDGWDVSGLDLAAAMSRAKVIDWTLQQQLVSHMKPLKPRPAAHFPGFVASNQEQRVDNAIPGTRQEVLDQLRRDIREFKSTQQLDTVVIVWTANTERFSEVREGLNDTADNLLAAIRANHSECTYINGSPQNTFVPGCLELAEHENVFVAGDDFKSGQTKLKSVLVDFLVSAGIKPVSIVSYNHLGNNDGKNLSDPQHVKLRGVIVPYLTILRTGLQVSKSNVVDDMVESNSILYKKGERPDHCVVIKYVPYVEIMLGGHNTIVVHNTCEDSLLASPLILDLALLAELCERVTVAELHEDDTPRHQPLRSVLSILSYLCKAPQVPHGAPVVNALFKQRSCIENVLRACIGLAPLNHMQLEHMVRPTCKHNEMVQQRNAGVYNGSHTNGDSYLASYVNGYNHEN